MSVTLYVLPA